MALYFWCFGARCLSLRTIIVNMNGVNNNNKERRFLIWRTCQRRELASDANPASVDGAFADEQLG